MQALVVASLVRPAEQVVIQEKLLTLQHQAKHIDFVQLVQHIVHRIAAMAAMLIQLTYMAQQKL